MNTFTATVVPSDRRRDHFCILFFFSPRLEEQLNNNARAMARFPGTLGPLRVRPDGYTFQGKVHDFSIMGAGLISEQRIAKGATLVAIESGRFRNIGQPLTAEVRHDFRTENGFLVAFSPAY
jgi:hypothetical protein